jgi:hypothetical protein
MQGVEQRISDVEGSIKELNVFLPGLTREQWKRDSSIAPQKLQKSIPEIKALVAVSRRLNASVPASDVATVGKRLLPLAKSEPEVWGITLDLASYRSSLNADERTDSEFSPFHEMTRYAIPRYHTEQPPEFMQPNLGVPIAESVRLEHIGETLNKDVNTAPPFLVATGGVVGLDGMYMRHIIWKSVTVHYTGGPLILEDVVFIGCTFVFDNAENARRLAGDILSSERVKFTDLKPTQI